MKGTLAKIERLADRRPVAVAFSILLPLALVCFGFLQYRWIGQISDAEQERIQEDLNQAVDRFARDFNGEPARLFQTLMAGGPAARFGRDPDYADRFWAWQETAVHPGLTRNVYLLGADGKLQQLNPETGAFQAVDWPTELEPLRVAARGARPPVFVATGTGNPALLFRFPFRGRPGPPPREPGSGFLVEFDLAFVKNEYIPQLARRHFGDRYAFRITDAGREVASAGLGAEHAGRPPDAGAGLFAMMFRPGAGAPGPMPPGPPPGLWKLEAWPREGSLAEIVAAARRRNLAAGVGVLGLIAVGIAALMLAARRARSLAEMQMDFVAGVSHELRTPLSVIGSAAENIADGVVGDPSRVRLYGTVIRDEGRRLSTMVEQLLSFAGAQTGRLKFEPGPVDVAGAVADAIAAAKPDIDRNGVRVESAIGEDVPPVRGDAALVALCIRNLVSNAAKHGGGTVQVAAAGRGGVVEVSVVDHGPGVAPGEEEQIFQPFERGRQAREQQVAGAGVGLSLVRRVAEALGGTVALSTTPGGGATFTLRLPAESES
ncbi:MAG: ATP-binding protein [Bryobacteraceae bacterium]